MELGLEMIDVRRSVHATCEYSDCLDAADSLLATPYLPELH